MTGRKEATVAKTRTTHATAILRRNIFASLAAEYLAADFEQI
jgi:hypothetical protein